MAATTSVIANARQSTSSVFMVVTRSAETITGLLDAASLSADILTIKARNMHHDVLTSSKLDNAVRTDELIVQAATRHTDIMEDAHKRNFPDVPFDRSAAFNSALETMKLALKA